jgi:hypothetical protein
MNGILCLQAHCITLLEPFLATQSMNDPLKTNKQPLRCNLPPDFLPIQPIENLTEIFLIIFALKGMKGTI